MSLTINPLDTNTLAISGSETVLAAMTTLLNVNIGMMNRPIFTLELANSVGSSAMVALELLLQSANGGSLNAEITGADWSDLVGTDLLVACSKTMFTPGTVAVENGSNQAVLTGGVWPTWAAGKTLVVNGVAYTVSSRDSNSTLTLTANYAGTTNATATYRLIGADFAPALLEAGCHVNMKLDLTGYYSAKLQATGGGSSDINAYGIIRGE